MDTTQYGESKYLTPQNIRDSPQGTDKKIGVVVGDVEVEDGKFGKQLALRVSLDQKIKVWKMSKENVQAMQKISKHSENWLTKKVFFHLDKTKDGKDKIVGEPIID